MEIKAQLQGNYENYLIGYLHCKADGSKVLLLPLCSSSIINRYSPVLVTKYSELQAKITVGT